jgi:RNA polymerase-binding transcription factor
MPLETARPSGSCTCSTHDTREHRVRILAALQQQFFACKANFLHYNKDTMDARLLTRYKGLLLAKQQEVLSARGGSTLPPRAEADALPDVIDKASAETELKVQVSLRQTESHLLRAIEEALVRIDQGSYGVCQICGKPIPKVRLDAVPWTRVCRECKESSN